MLAILGMVGCLFWAQLGGGTGKITGEIVIESEGGTFLLRLSGWAVELRQPGAGRMAARAAVGAGGWFEFAGLAPGGYQVDVIDATGRVVRSEQAWVQPGAAGTDLRILIRDEADRAGGAISLKRLAHKPPKAARKEYESAMRELAKKKTASALSRLERAVAADPEFFEARFELGLALAREERAAEALPHLEAAAAIDPGPAELHLTIAWALLVLNRNADAERAAGEALQRYRGLEAAHYLRGLARLTQNKLDVETLDHLERASLKFPRARQAAEWVRERVGNAIIRH